MAACPPAINQQDPLVASKLAEEQQKLAAAMSDGTSAPLSAYVDGGMHPSFRAILKSSGAKAMASRVSGTKYPISRPEAALADPFAGVR